MKYLKNLFVLLMFVLFPLCAIGAEYQVKVNSAGSYSAFEVAPPPKPLFTGTIPEGFPGGCLAEKTLRDGETISCKATTEANSRFNLGFLPTVVRTMEEQRYSVTVMDSGLIITSDTPVPKTEPDIFNTILMVYVVALGILFVSARNGWTRTGWERLFAFYGTLLGSVAIGVFAGALAGAFAGGFASVSAGAFAGGLAGGSAGVFAGALAGGFAGGLAGVFAGALAGGFAGGLASQYSWAEAGITEYLVFIGIVCLIGWALREVVAFARNRFNREPEDDDGEDRPAGMLD